MCYDVIAFQKLLFIQPENYHSDKHKEIRDYKPNAAFNFMYPVLLTGSQISDLSSTT